MSETTKEQVKRIKKLFETVRESAGELSKEAGKFDKDLSTRIEKVKTDAGEVVKHIEKKSE
jgi:hypothetical protein